MEVILQKLFLENNFKKYEISHNLLLYEAKNQDYFFVSSFEEKEINDFFNSEKTNNIIRKQNELYEIKESIKKNSTLVILVKINDLEDFLIGNRNEIYKIEEDAYHFRKLIIAYTDKSIKEIKESEIINEKIYSILKNSDRMKEFEKDLYKDEEYYLIIQLFVKLSFLKLEMKEEGFTPIRTKINTDLETKGLYEDYVGIKTWISEHYHENWDEEKYFRNLEESFYDLEKDDETLLELINGLGGLDNKN